MILTNDKGEIIHAMLLDGSNIGNSHVPQGSKLVCPEGHLIATASADLNPGDSWAELFEFVGKAVEVGSPREACRCPSCDAIWLWPEPPRLND